MVFWVLPESPFFLFEKRRLEAAHAALLTIGRVNEPSQLAHHDTKLTEMLAKLSLYKKPRERGATDLRTRKEVFARVPLICVLFLNICVGYYLSSLVTQSIGNWGIYVNGFLMELSEFTAYFTVVLFANRLKRRLMNIAVGGGLLSMSTLLLLLEFVPGAKTSSWLSPIQTTLSVAIRFIIGMNFALLYNYTAELLPTAYRGRGLGIAGVFNKMGGVAASWFEAASKRLAIHPMIFAGAFAVFAIPAAMALPETLNMEIA